MSIDPIPAPLALTALKYVLAATPKADDNAHLSCVVLDHDRLIACDEHAWHRAVLNTSVTRTRTKITRASAAGLARMLDGAIKAGKERGRVVTVTWRGRLVEIVTQAAAEKDEEAPTEGQNAINDEPICYELDLHEMGPIPEVWIEVGDSAELAPPHNGERIVLPTDRTLAAFSWSLADAETATHVHRDIDSRTRFDTVWGDRVVATAIVAAPTFRIELRQLPLFPTTGGVARAKDALQSMVDASAGVDSVTLSVGGKKTVLARKKAPRKGTAHA